MLPPQTYKILFFGTEYFAVQMLEFLRANPRVELVGVVTREDKPAGRGHELTPPPAKVWSEKQGIAVLQPARLKELKAEIDLPPADMYVVCEYGRIIPEHLLEAPRFKTINVHPSLLPQYRGASPIQAALFHGDTETGVTIMRMDKDLDHGPILSQEKLPVSPHDTFSVLREKLAPLAGQLLVKTLDAWVDRKITPQIQDDTKATFCKLIDKEDGRINFSQSATEIYNHYRAFELWPGTFTTWQGKLLKLLKLKPYTSRLQLAPGKIEVHDGLLLVGTATAPLEILILQREGGKPLEAKVFLQGAQGFVGGELGI
jgi:methionyl-tRNA formyltransferase